MELIFAAAVPKEPGERGEADNEDIWDIDESSGRVVLCDGASESYDAKSWARLLCDRFLQQPSVDAAWAAAAAAAQAQVDPASLPWSRRAAWQRGSFATLLGVEWDAPQRMLHLHGVGDSLLLAVWRELPTPAPEASPRDQWVQGLAQWAPQSKLEQTNLWKAEKQAAPPVHDDVVETRLITGLRSWPYEDAEQFAQRPLLLSSLPEHNAFVSASDFNALCRCSLPVREGQDMHLLLMTDALGAWVLAGPADGHADAAATLLALNSAAAFEHLVEEERAAGRMRRDDTTLLVLRIPASLP